MRSLLHLWNHSVLILLRRVKKRVKRNQKSQVKKNPLRSMIVVQTVNQRMRVNLMRVNRMKRNHMQRVDQRMTQMRQAVIQMTQVIVSLVAIAAAVIVRWR